MKAASPKHIWTTVSLAIIVFIFFLLPNSQASTDPGMVRMFQPDEGAQLAVVEQMLTPKATPYLSFIKFVAYDYYYYGFPFFGSSALALHLFRLTGIVNDTAGSMLVLRQVISVLPMLAAILILVWLQDHFTTWRSPLLFLILLAIPAVISNGLWWHPDGIVLLLVSLVLFFLWKDERRLGRNFFISAVCCGILTATKLIGVFFFLTIGLHLLWAILEKKLTIRQAVLKGLLFIVIMCATFVLSNPFLLSPWGREQYLNIVTRQASLLEQGYDLIYPKGPAVVTSGLHEYFGSAAFLLLALGAAIWRLFKNAGRAYAALSLAWLIPIALYQSTTIHFKYQYWLPVLLPLLSNLTIPDPEPNPQPKQPRAHLWISLLAIILSLFQTAFHLARDIKLIEAHYLRAQNNPAIRFYNEVDALLAQVKTPLNIYYDYRLYLPESAHWTKQTSFEMLNYQTIQDGNFDVLLLQRQRMLDYLNPDAVAIDPDRLKQSREFYQDARQGTLRGFHRLYQTDLASVFISQQLCRDWYHLPQCQP